MERRRCQGRCLAFLLLCAVALNGCSSALPQQSALPIDESGAASSLSESAPETRLHEGEETPDDTPFRNDYIRDVAGRMAGDITAPEMTNREKVMAAYEHLVIHAYFSLPLGMEDWRYQGQGQIPGIFEIMGYSPLAYGTGYCEEYAAAMMLLLWEMGFETRYVTGLTPSVGGRWVDHAWLMVCLEGQWYHLDPQLEDNVTREGQLRYRYFLRDDDYMARDHRWGERLIDPQGRPYTHDFNDPLEPNQWMEALAAAGVDVDAPYPNCTSVLATPAPRAIHKPPQPDGKALAGRIAREQEKLAAQNGTDQRALPYRLPYEGREPG